MENIRDQPIRSRIIAVILLWLALPGMKQSSPQTPRHDVEAILLSNPSHDIAVMSGEFEGPLIMPLWCWKTLASLAVLRPRGVMPSRNYKGREVTYWGNGVKNERVQPGRCSPSKMAHSFQDRALPLALPLVNYLHWNLSFQEDNNLYYRLWNHFFY